MGHPILLIFFTFFNLRRRINAELELRLLREIHRKSLHEKRCESGSGSASERVEDEEALETAAVVSQLADPLHHGVDNLFADRVVTTSVVVGCVFLAAYHLLGVKQGAVRTCANLVWKEQKCWIVVN